MDVHPTKNVSIGIDPYPYFYGEPSGDSRRAFVAGALSDGGVTAELRDDGVAHGLSLLTRRSSA